MGFYWSCTFLLKLPVLDCMYSITVHHDIACTVYYNLYNAATEFLLRALPDFISQLWRNHSYEIKSGSDLRKLYRKCGKLFYVFLTYQAPKTNIAKT